MQTDVEAVHHLDRPANSGGNDIKVQLTGLDGCLIESAKTFLTFWKGGRVPDKEFQTFERVCDVKLVSRSGKYTSTTINTI
jgi:hypothetical protein